jgi:hypothetical protein
VYPKDLYLDIGRTADAGPGTGIEGADILVGSWRGPGQRVNIYRDIDGDSYQGKNNYEHKIIVTLAVGTNVSISVAILLV